MASEAQIKRMEKLGVLQETAGTNKTNRDRIFNHFKNNFVDFYSKYLPDIKRAGANQHKTLCPFHEETTASFTFNNELGTFYCHGCKSGGDIFTFYGLKNGLDYRADFPKILEGIATEFGIFEMLPIGNKPTPIKQDKGEFVKAYDYTDENGNLLFQVCRYENPKGFSQRRPDGKGGWINNLNGVQTVLYNLPEVIKADRVIIVEGEKDADNLIMLGFTATTNPMGAGKWKEHYNESLGGKDIVFIPDNDEPGRRHMEQVAISLDGIASSLKWLDLPDLPEKGDGTDFIMKFSDPNEAAERLSTMIGGLEPYTPPKKNGRLKITTLSDVFDYPETTYLIQDLIPENIIAVIGGYTGIGKSFLVLGIVKSVITGKPFLGKYAVNRTGPVLVVDEETPKSLLKDRIKKMGFDASWPVYFLHFQEVKIDKESIFNELVEKVREIQPVLVVFDSLIRIHRKREKESEEMAQVIDALRKIANLGTTVMPIHHHKKGGGPLAEKLRGSSDIPGGIDIEFALTPEKEGSDILIFQSVKTRIKPLQPIQIKLNVTSTTAAVEYHGTQNETILEIVKDLISDKPEHLTVAKIVELINDSRKDKLEPISAHKIRNALIEGHKNGILDETEVKVGKVNASAYRVRQ